MREIVTSDREVGRVRRMQHWRAMHEPTMTSLLQHASRVRSARRDDRWEIAALIDRAMTMPHADADDLEDLLEGGHLLVLDVAGEIRGVACVRLERRRGHLGFLVIDPALEGQGLEERLRGVASALCEARGCPSMDIQ
jgi:N-acetylglutamate synthase-like GNAT family acetyltransferase